MPASSQDPPRGLFLDPRDGQEYGTLAVEGRVWMTRNMSFETLEGSRFYYDHETSSEHGRLYTRAAAQEAPPPGWHLADEGDWASILATLGPDPERAFDRLIRRNALGLSLTLSGVIFMGNPQTLDSTGYYWADAADPGLLLYASDRRSGLVTMLSKSNIDCASCRCVRDA